MTNKRTGGDNKQRTDNVRAAAGTEVAAVAEAAADLWVWDGRFAEGEDYGQERRREQDAPERDEDAQNDGA
jgi:hypothetical protein